LLAVCHTVDLKKYGFGQILEPFLEKLTKLSSEGGVDDKSEWWLKAVTMRAADLVSFWFLR
jgi:hypothetical protein